MNITEIARILSATFIGVSALIALSAYLSNIKWKKSEQLKEDSRFYLEKSLDFLEKARELLMADLKYQSWSRAANIVYHLHELELSIAIEQHENIWSMEIDILHDQLTNIFYDKECFQFSGLNESEWNEIGNLALILVYSGQESKKQEIDRFTKLLKLMFNNHFIAASDLINIAIFVEEPSLENVTKRFGSKFQDNLWDYSDREVRAKCFKFVRQEFLGSSMYEYIRRLVIINKAANNHSLYGGGFIDVLVEASVFSTLRDKPT